MTTSSHTTEDWTDAWPDVLAFAVGLALAWRGKWTTTDLVWSLWLSSLVVGYATILWTILRPAMFLARGNWRGGTGWVRVGEGPARPASALLMLPFLLLGGLFLLAFFTVHFGGFHYIHSQFLGSFFPIHVDPTRRIQSVGMAEYAEVVRRYWVFLPAAFLAERAAFLSIPATPAPDPSAPKPTLSREERLRRAMDGAGEAAGGTKSGRRNAFGDGIGAPYRNVVRMHLLIFFFGFAHAAGLESFAVYTVVYAVYFFPWRLVRRGPVGATSPVRPA
jgi:hypothetical protein